MDEHRKMSEMSNVERKAKCSKMHVVYYLACFFKTPIAKAHAYVGIKMHRNRSVMIIHRPP